MARDPASRRGRGRAPREPTPRVRDLPPPRKNPSVTGPLIGRLGVWPYRVILAGLHRAGLRAWHLTLLSLLTNLAVGALLVTGRRILPGLLLIPAGLFDVFDGALARLRGEVSRRGALVDAVNDRISDAVVFGALVYSLLDRGSTAPAAVALAALVASLFVSHIRAEGEAAGLDVSGGLFQRLERYLALILGLAIPGALLPVLALLTALGAVTALQRTAVVWRQLPRPGEGRSG